MPRAKKDPTETKNPHAYGSWEWREFRMKQMVKADKLMMIGFTCCQDHMQRDPDTKRQLDGCRVSDNLERVNAIPRWERDEISREIVEALGAESKVAPVVAASPSKARRFMPS